MKIVITGASKGIGLAIAHEFASHGHDLFLTSRTEKDLSTIADQLMNRFPAIQIEYMAADLSKEESVQDFTDWVLSKTVPDVLVNNAGTYLPGKIVEAASTQFMEQLQLNLFAALHTTRALVPSMIQKGSGHIINICSIAALQAYENGGAYSISKYALDGFSKNLRVELKDKGIKVTTIYPGAVYTKSWAGSGVDPKRIMEAKDIAIMIYAATQLSNQAVVEEMVLRPLLGDL